jgi:hypothetical protein
MIELKRKEGTIFCELITIQETPFIFLSTLTNVQDGINQLYPVRYYSIERAVENFINYLNIINQNENR